MSIRDAFPETREGDGPLPQVELRWLGGVKTILGRLTFYRGTLTFLMIIPVAYNSSPVLQGWFPSVFVFGAFMAFVLACAGVVEYSIIYPSQILFNKAQSAKNGRDPIYEKCEKLEDRQQEVLDRLEEMDD